MIYVKGFSVDGQENIQEILSKRLYLCQFLCALMVLKSGQIYCVNDVTVTNNNNNNNNNVNVFI